MATLSRTSGLPHVMVRRNMGKIHHALTHMATVLNGLSRGLDLSVIDSGSGEQFGTKLAFFPTTEALGLVMPSNSPAVNSLWLPSIALKTPVIIKPGREEPWTPYRLIQAFIAAGAPPEAFGFYPTDHEGSGEILRTCGRALVFGDPNTTAMIGEAAAFVGDLELCARTRSVLRGSEGWFASHGSMWCFVNDPVDRYVGLTAAALGDTGEAVESLERALRMRPDEPQERTLDSRHRSGVLRRS